MEFQDKIKKIIKKNGYSYKIRSWKNSEYTKVVIYAGRNIEKLAQKRSMKLVAYKDLKGNWQGDMEAVKQQKGKGDKIYLRDYHDTVEPLKYVMFSDCDWNDDEVYAKNKLLKVLKGWKIKV